MSFDPISRRSFVRLSTAGALAVATPLPRAQEAGGQAVFQIVGDRMVRRGHAAPPQRKVRAASTENAAAKASSTPVAVSAPPTVPVPDSCAVTPSIR